MVNSVPCETEKVGVTDQEKDEYRLTTRPSSVLFSTSSSDVTAAPSRVESERNSLESGPSQISTLPPPPPPPPPPPDGGLRAWLQVAAGHLTVFNAWGMINSFGIFQGTYEQTLQLPPSSISWIGSFQVWLLFFVSTFSGRALDGGYYQHVLVAGCFFQVFGIFMTSLAGDTYWKLFLAQGVCQGIGNGLCFCPTIALVSTYFEKRRTFAVATAAAGGATGGIVFPLIAQRLLPRVGFAWTLRTMGFVVLFNSVLIVLLLRTRLPPRKAGPIVELALFRELPYTLFTAAMFFALWGIYYGYYYVRTFAVDVLEGVDDAVSFDLLLLLNAVGLPGRLVPAFLADRYFPGMPINLLIPSIFVSGLCLFLWATVHDLAGYYVWVVFYGWVGATVQGLFPATLASLSDNPSKNGTRIGMAFSIVSIACLTGPPLAGRLIQVQNGSYLAAQMWAGSTLVLGSAVALAAKIVLDRQRKAKKESA